MSTQIEFLARLEGDLRAAAACRPRQSLRQWSRAPRVLITAVVVVLMSCSLALAFGGRVLTALGGGPAPAPVKAAFKAMVEPHRSRDGAPPFEALHDGTIVPGSEHRVLSVRTLRGTTATLFAARTSSGKLCAVTHGWAFGGAGCWSTPASPASGSLFAILAPSSYTPHRTDTRRALFGRTANVRAATLRVIYRDGAHDDVALAGGWFMFEVPLAHEQRAVAPVRLDVLAVGGARLGSVADPFRLDVPMPHFTKPVPASVKLLASAVLPNDGGTVRIWSGVDAQGRECFRHLRNGKSQVFPVWECTAQVGRSSYPVYPLNARQIRRRVAARWQMGFRNDSRHPVGYGYAYATGWVGPRVARLTVRFQDGSAADVVLHDGFYVYVVPAANWRAGHRPSILEARAADGSVVSRQFLYPRQHCLYPGRDPVCNESTATG
jgi:hypothetical protein